MTENNKINEKKKKPDQVEKVDKEDLSIESKLKDTEEKLLRSLAEIENQRKRFEKELKDAFEFGSFNFAKETLAIPDNLQRAKLAIENDVDLKKNKDLGKFLENLTIIEKDMTSIFERNGIKKIETEGKKFDPNFHQAMSEIDNDVDEPGTVIQEIQAGYMMSERLLRPALVGVAKKKEVNIDKKEEK